MDERMVDVALTELRQQKLKVDRFKAHLNGNMERVSGEREIRGLRDQKITDRISV